MKLKLLRTFSKAYAKLPKNIQKKTDKQITLITHDFQHPSLHSKKIKGTEDIWEGRVDYQYRFTFQVEETTIVLRNVGPHDILKKP